MSKFGTFLEYVLSEGLEPEISLFNKPAQELYIDMDEEDSGSGTLHYMGYEFPVTKTTKGGMVQYFVGNVATGKTIQGRTPNDFSKVLAAIDAGQIKPSTHTSGGPKVRRYELGTSVPVWYTNPYNGKPYMKYKKYMPPQQAEKFIIDLYRSQGNRIFAKGDESPLYPWATDNDNYKNEFSQFIDLKKWMSKFNFADRDPRKSGYAAGILGKRTRE